MDENIGKILDALDKNELTDNTLIAFMSDNGATFAYPVNWPEEWEKELLGSNGILRGHKGQMYEGGVRVPFIMRYPKVLKAGQVYREPVSALDLYPTFCAAAEAVPNHDEKLDGVNLIPYLLGKKNGSPHDILYWLMEDEGAVRLGDYKYHYYKGKSELYNLENDISETKDLSEQEPEIKRKLEEAYQAFVNSLPPPVNPNRFDKFNLPDKK
jgi:arylsulfatase A-like enzyme